MRRTRKQRGGNYIGQGSFGCSFYKPLKCKGAPRKEDRLSKLINNKHLPNEWGPHDLLYRIDPVQQYFLYPESVCDLNTNNIKPENNIKKCTVPIQHPKLLMNLFGGTDLTKLKLNSIQYTNFFTGFLNIFKGVETLHINNIVHNDIKPENMVALVDKTNKFKVRLIDFGFTFNVNDVDVRYPTLEDKSKFERSYQYWSFDLIIVWLLAAAIENPEKIKEKQYKELLTDHLQEYRHKFNKEHNSKYYPREFLFNGLDEDNDFNPDTLRNLVNSSTSYYWSMPPKTSYIELFKRNDVFSVGITLYQILYRFIGIIDIGIDRPKIVNSDTYKEIKNHGTSADEKKYYTDITNELFIPLYNLIRDMVRMDSKNRISISAAKDRYNALLSKITYYFENKLVYTMQRLLNPTGWNSADIEEINPIKVAAPLIAAKPVAPILNPLVAAKPGAPILNPLVAAKPGAPILNPLVAAKPGAPIVYVNPLIKHTRRKFRNRR